MTDCFDADFVGAFEYKLFDMEKAYSVLSACVEYDN